MDEYELKTGVQRIQRLPRTAHLFCGKDEAPQSFEPHGTVKQEKIKVEDETGEVPVVSGVDVPDGPTRRQLAFDGMLVFALDDQEAAIAQVLRNRVGLSLSGCDQCLRRYHMGRSGFERQLKETYPDDAVEEFLVAIDCWDMARIEGKLMTAAEKIKSLGEEKLSIARVLTKEELMALFEVLCNPKVVKKPSIKIYFTSIFDAPQALKTLAISSYTPAVTLFAFDSRETRHSWALKFWLRTKQPPTEQEFEWTVRVPLQQAIARFGTEGIDGMYIPRFWSALSAIFNKLSTEQLKIVLSEYEVSLTMIIWDRLPVDRLAYPDIVNVISELIRRVPQAFWQAMSDHSAPQLVERILNSPSSDTFLTGQRGPTHKLFHPSTLLSWVLPLMESQDSRTRSTTCQPLAFHLLDRFQYEKVPELTRLESRLLGLQVISMTLQPFTKSNIEGDSSSVSILISEGLARAADHADFIRDTLRRKSELIAQGSVNVYDMALQVVTSSLTVECNLLRYHYFAMTGNEAPTSTQLASAQPLWINVNHYLDPSSATNVSRILAGLQHLYGLQKFNQTIAIPQTPPRINFDRRLSVLTNTFAEVLSQIPSARNDEVRQLFSSSSSIQSITAALVNSEDEIAELALDLIKVAYGGEGRQEATTNLLLNGRDGVSFLTAYSAILQTASAHITLSAAAKTLKMSAALLTGLEELRSAEIIADPEGLSKVVPRLWTYQWQALRTSFEKMDAWTYKTSQKIVNAIDFARDVIQFAKALLDKLEIFESFIGDVFFNAGNRNTDGNGVRKSTKSVLLRVPNRMLATIVRWLRIKDPYLNSTITNLVHSLLMGLHEASIEPNTEAMEYLMTILKGEQRTVMDEDSISLLRKAVKAFGVAVPAPVATAKISINDSTSGRSTPDVVIEASKTVEAFRQKQKAMPALQPQPLAQVAAKTANDFKLKRQREIEAKKLRDAQQLARIRKDNPSAVAALTADANDMGHRLGYEGVDHNTVHSPAVLSDEDTSSSDDEGLFELTEKKTNNAFRKTAKSSKAAALRVPPRQAPVVKIKQARTAKDLRARTTPNLASLHQTVLQWDVFYQGRYPPGTDQRDYRPVSKEFRSPQDYRATFEPLLLMECWQGFLNGKEELSTRPFDMKVVSRATTGAFFELASGVSFTDLKQASLREADILVLSIARQPLADGNVPHCLARISSTNIRKKGGDVEIKLKIALTGPMIQHLTPGAAVSAIKLTSLITLEREYGALLGLQYYDLCDEIARAKPSPIIKRAAEALQEVIQRYKINPAQAQAVLSAWDNDGFTLVQGPPGTGKTKTIIAMAGGLLNDLSSSGTTIAKPTAPNPGGTVAKKRLLICAPSNAAVDELIIRLRAGVHLRNGKRIEPKVLRLGHSESAIPQVRDLTWEHQIDARMQEAVSGGTDHGAEIQNQLENIRLKNQAIEQLQGQLDLKRQSGDTVASTRLDEQIRTARNEKSRMGTKLDTLRDKKNSAARDIDVRRRKYQLEILNEAQIVCATLSGTGNEKLSNMTSIEFDTIIIDEAAQAIELSALIPLKYGCTKCILVGDPKQLPPTVFSMEAKDLQYEQSLFVRMQDNYPDDVHLLNTQYRMHPDISRFPSLTFYDNKLQDGPEMAKQRTQPWHDSSLFTPYRFFDIYGVHRAGAQGRSLVNHAEADIAYHLYARLVKDWHDIDFSGKIGIITPYKAQLDLLKRVFQDKIGEEKMEFIDFNTIDAFQGRECEVIIYSCVRASGRGIGFLADIRRMNVALTRAKSSLWILGNFESLRQGKFWKDLLENAKARDCYTDGDIIKLATEKQRRKPAALKTEIKSSSKPISWPAKMDLDSPPTVRSSKPGARAPISIDFIPRSDSNNPFPSTTSSTKPTTMTDRSLPKPTTTLPPPSVRLSSTTKGPAWPPQPHPGNCRRCNLAVHPTNHCREEVCMSCGALGHSVECLNPEANGAMRVRTKEGQYGKAQDDHIARQKRIRMGNHDVGVPVVRVSSAAEIRGLSNGVPGSSSPIAGTGPGATKGAQDARRNSSAGGKRKRDAADQPGPHALTHPPPPPLPAHKHGSGTKHQQQQQQQPRPPSKPELLQVEKDRLTRRAEMAAQETMGRHYERLTNTGGISNIIASADLRGAGPAGGGNRGGGRRDWDGGGGGGGSGRRGSGGGGGAGSGKGDRNGDRGADRQQQEQQQTHGPGAEQGEKNGKNENKKHKKKAAVQVMRRVQHNFGPGKAK